MSDYFKFKVGDRVRRLYSTKKKFVTVTEIFKDGTWFNHDGDIKDYHSAGGCHVKFWELVAPTIKEQIIAKMQPGCFYSATSIAEELNIGSKQVSARLSELQRSGLVYNHDHKWTLITLITDKERLDWLSENLFYRENVDCVTGKLDKKHDMWVMFSPKGIRGSARTIIDAAILASRKS